MAADVYMILIQTTQNSPSVWTRQLKITAPLVKHHVVGQCVQNVQIQWSFSEPVMIFNPFTADPVKALHFATAGQPKPALVLRIERPNVKN